MKKAHASGLRTTGCATRQNQTSFRRARQTHQTHRTRSTAFHDPSVATQIFQMNSGSTSKA